MVHAAPRRYESAVSAAHLTTMPLTTVSVNAVPSPSRIEESTMITTVQTNERKGEAQRVRTRKGFAHGSSILISCSLTLGLLFGASTAYTNPISLFDGKTLKGWEGDAKTWRVEDGAITGGSLTTDVLRNEFLATTESFQNFDLRMKLKLTGAGGF